MPIQSSAERREVMKIKTNGVFLSTRDNADGISYVNVMLLSFLASLLSLALPFSLVDTAASAPISWIVCITAGILLILASKKFSSIIVLALVFTFVMSYAESPMAIALVIGTVAACGIYSAIVSAARGRQIPLLLIAPAVSCAVTFFLTASLPLTLIALAPFLPSLAMGIAARQSESRTTSIASFAFVAVFEVAIAVLSHIYIQNGYLSFEVINDSASYFWSESVDLLVAAIDSAGNVPVTEDILIQVRAMATELTNLLVGTVVAIFLIIGFLAQKIQLSTFERFDLEKLQNISGAPIKASVAAAIVYTAAHIFSYTSSVSSAPSFTAAVGANVSLIFLPLLLYVGFEFMAHLPQKLGFLALLVWLGIFMAAYLLSSSVLDIIALIGAFYTLLVNIDLWAEEHYSKGEDS
jgi:hypothetical protein